MSEKDQVVEILKKAIAPPFKAVMGRGDGRVTVSGRPGWCWVRKVGKTELLMEAYNRGAPAIEGIIVHVKEARVEGIKGYEIVGVDHGTSPPQTYPDVVPHAWTHEWRPGIGRDRVTVYPRAWGYLRAEPIVTGSMAVWVTPGWIYYDGEYSWYAGGYSPAFGAPAGGTWWQTLYLDPSDETLHIVDGVTGGYGYAQVPSPPECMIPIAAVQATGTFGAVTENMIEDIRLFMDPIAECGDLVVHTHATDAEGGQLDWDDIWSDAVHSHANAGEGGQLDWDSVWSDAIHDHSAAAEGGQITAGDVINVPAGGIAATDVQSAINELDTEKAGINDTETIGASWTWSGTNRIYLRDAQISIYSGADGFLDIVADTAIRLTSPVGIGGTPDEELHVIKSQNTITAIKISNVNAGTSARTRLILENDEGFAFFNLMPSTHPTRPGELAISQIQNRSLIFETNSGLRVTIDNAGHTYPAGNKTQDFGLPASAWDDAYADDWHNVADLYLLDRFDDLAVICGMKASGEIDPRTGLPLIDDESLPEWVFTKDKEGREVLYDPDGRPYLSVKMLASLSFGAIRQLKEWVERLEAQIPV